MVLDKKDIIGIYDKLKNLAFKAQDSGCYEKSLKYIEISAWMAYTFSWIIKDDELESLMKDISKSIFKLTTEYNPIADKYVFYDSISHDNVGLSQQYIRALIANNLSFLYITESKRTHQSKNIFSEIEEYNKAEISKIPQKLKRTEKAKFIYERLISYRPSKLFMHLMPNSVNALTAFYALPNEITKYQINTTDHAFWLGTNCLDYSLEFRPYGCTLSKIERTIDEDKILLLPYYPIISASEFQGFPEVCEGKVIVFSGGSYTKILGENNLFLNLVKQILLANSQAVFLYAGGGDSTHIEKFINDAGLEERFILLGLRTDINEVFKHCDIYMSTYPFGGGLMGQFAAVNGKPILSYSKPEKVSSWPEETVCQLKKIRITHTDIDGFLLEAHKLIYDSDYRMASGKTLKECVISVDKFNRIFEQSVVKNINQLSYDVVDVNVDLVFEHGIDIENINNEIKIFLFKTLKFNVPFVSPKIFFWAFTYMFTKSFLIKLFHRFPN
jgi:hypothetical protein